MKQLLFLSVVLVSLGSCVNQRQKTNLTGRTDEVYFTPSDTRIKGNISSQSSRTHASTATPAAKNYTGSYSDRLSNFGSGNRFSYNNYQPVLLPSLMYNNYTGWTLGLSYGNPMMMGGYNSPFSPYYGYNMPFNNPFYANGWGGGWMTNYYPCYTYNPYMYGNNGYGSYGGYNNYNSYYNYNKNNNNSYNNSGNTNYGRRTGNYSPSTQNNSGQRTEYKSPNSTSTSNGSSSSNSSGGGGWWKTSTGSGSTTSSGGNTGGGGSRSGGSSSTNTSTRRR